LRDNTDRIRRVYIPMTETGFYILFCLQEEMHGYNIIQKVRQLTGGEIIISAGTMYGSLSKMEEDGLIEFTREEGKRRFYIITDLGSEILAGELKRIERLYKNSKGESV
jgi:DNA-binding PadR family transcriptional regulator